MAGLDRALLPSKNEVELGSKIILELQNMGVAVSRREHKEIINFTLLRSKYLLLQSGGLNKRKLENNLKFRINTLKRIYQQSKRDQISYFLREDEFLRRQFFLALLECAALIHERKTKNDIRNAQAIDLHLWVINQILINHKIAKPTYTLAALLNKVRYWRGLGASLKVGTIENRLTKANKIIGMAVNKGASPPDTISDSPLWHSSSFVVALSRGCPECSRVWFKVLGVKESKEKSWDMAVIELKKKLPELGKQIQEANEYIKDNIPLPDLFRYLPSKYKVIFDHLY